jgi:integrase
MSVIVRGKNPNKPYTVRYWVDGRQKERSFSTRQEAQDFKIKTDHDLRAQIFVDDKLGRQKFSEAATTWLERISASPRSKEVYGSLLKMWIIPALGDKTLTQVANDRDSVTDLLTRKMAHISYSRRVSARRIILDTIQEAVISGKLPRHRLQDIDLINNGNGNHSDFVFPSHAQLTQLADDLEELSLTIWLMRGCGLRIQEALAVQKSCFRDDGKTLRIHEQMKRDGSNTIPLKHRKLGDFRDIPVPSYLWEMVKDIPDGYFFNGVTYYTYSARFRRRIRKIGIQDGFTPHSLRHVFASTLLGHGVPITDVAKWLGHQNINVTYSIYGHLISSAASRAVSVLDSEYQEWSAEQP